MDKHLQDLLLVRFEALFPSRFYIECGNGWFNLIWTSLAAIEQEIKIVADQNKYRQLQVHNISNKITPFSDLTDQQASCEITNQMARIQPEIHFSVVQIKEKFGTMRFYYDGGNEIIQGIVTMTEMVSGNTCEVCGNSGTLRPGGWLRTLCDKHHVAQPQQSNCNALKEGAHIPVVQTNAIVYYSVLQVIDDHTVTAAEVLKTTTSKDTQEVIVEYGNPKTLTRITIAPDNFVWMQQSTDLKPN